MEEAGSSIARHDLPNRWLPWICHVVARQLVTGSNAPNAAVLILVDLRAADCSGKSGKLVPLLLLASSITVQSRCRHTMLRPDGMGIGSANADCQFGRPYGFAAEMWVAVDQKLDCLNVRCQIRSCEKWRLVGDRPPSCDPSRSHRIGGGRLAHDLEQQGPR